MCNINLAEKRVYVYTIKNFYRSSIFIPKEKKYENDIFAKHKQ